MTKNNPLITVVTVVYNGIEFLEKTIQNVIGQTYSNFEYIIIDGGSTDGTLDIIKKYENQITKWISEPDKGIYDAMNKGIVLANGRWINFMNAGDFFYEQETLQKVFGGEEQYNGVDILYGDVECDYLDFKVIQKAGKLSNLWTGMQFCHQSTFIRSAYHKELPYSLDYKIAGDFNFIYRSFMSDTPMVHIEQIVALFCMDGVSVVSGEKGLIENYKIVGDSLTVSQKVYYFLLLLRTKIRRNLLPRFVFNFFVKRNWV